MRDGCPDGSGGDWGGVGGFNNLIISDMEKESERRSGMFNSLEVENHERD
jgi:hypothetical protein